MKDQPRFDVDKWWKDVQELQRDARRVSLNATCPLCHADLLDRVEYAAFEEQDCPGMVYVRCPSCDTELKFHLEWETLLSRARCSATVCGKEWEPDGRECQTCNNYPECDRRYVIAFQHV